MQKLNLRVLTVGAILALTFLARTAIAQRNDNDSPDDDSQSACLSDASDSYASCSNNASWYEKILCAAQQAADDLDCGAGAMYNKMY